MDTLFDTPSRRYSKLARKRLIAKGYPEFDDNQARGKGGQWTAGGGKPVVRGGKVGLAAALVALLNRKLRRTDLRGQFIGARGLGREALSGTGLPVPTARGGVFERDVVRHVRQAATAEGASFASGVRNAERIGNSVARRQAIRAQGGTVRPLPKNKRREPTLFDGRGARR